MALRNPEFLEDALIDGCAHVETPSELRQRLQRGKPLQVKFGVDPTGSELHLGHAVVLHKMQQFVEAGHAVTLLIGDFTALIGDPSGRNDSRPHLTPETIAENMRTYTAQAGKILDLERISVRYNSEWLAKLNLADLIGLLAQSTVAQMLSREDFRKRYLSETPIALHEFLYPVAQAYDSVALACDVELGGDDQLFNFLLARTYQTNAGLAPQICMTLPILEGTDGKIRMGKSRGNYVALCEPARDQFGKTMSIPDELIARWARLTAFRPQAECEAIERGIRDGSRVAMEEKKMLAEAIVARYHGPDAARRARDDFERMARKERPHDVPDFQLDWGGERAPHGRESAPAGDQGQVHPHDASRPSGKAKKLIDVMVDAGLADSKRSAQRLIAQGAVRVDDVVATDPATLWTATAPALLQVGSHRFVRVLPNKG